MENNEVAFKILIAGFQHETNTFAPSPATYESFVHGEGHPAMVRGEAMLALRDVNLPIGGFIRASEQQGHTLMPVIWTAASPSAHVTEDAYERIVGEMVAAAAEGGFDAVYLDLHGAMVARHVDDGEGELLACSPAPTRSSPTARIRMWTWPKPAHEPSGCWRSCLPRASRCRERRGVCHS